MQGISKTEYESEAEGKGMEAGLARYGCMGPKGVQCMVTLTVRRKAVFT